MEGTTINQKLFTQKTYTYNVSTLLDILKTTMKMSHTIYQRTPSYKHVQELHTAQLQFIEDYGEIVFISPIIIFNQTYGADSRIANSGCYYILDGQHRIKMLEQYPDKYKDQKINVNIITQKDSNSPGFKQLFEAFHRQMPMFSHVVKFNEYPILKVQFDMFREYVEFNYNDQLGKTLKDIRKPHLFYFEQLFSDFEDLCHYYRDTLEKCTDDNLLILIFKSINAGWLKKASKGIKTIKDKLKRIFEWANSFESPVTSICFYTVKTKSNGMEYWYEQGDIYKQIKDCIMTLKQNQ